MVSWESCNGRTAVAYLIAYLIVVPPLIQGKSSGTAVEQQEVKYDSTTTTSWQLLLWIFRTSFVGKSFVFPLQMIHIQECSDRLQQFKFCSKQWSINDALNYNSGSRFEIHILCLVLDICFLIASMFHRSLINVFGFCLRPYEYISIVQHGDEQIMPFVSDNSTRI